MTLFLQNDAGGSGSGGVHADRGFMDLLQIANLDTGVGQDAPVGDLIHITYARTLGGIPPTRLDALVNTDFAGVAGTTDIIVVPVDETFTRPNGQFVTQNAGLTFPVGHSENPTSSVLVVYDTSDNGGSGYSLPAVGGGTVGFASSVILFHELSHAFRDATNASLNNSASGCTASAEEHAAEDDENDMRDQLGEPKHRDPTNHCSATGNPTSCCIVASISTGSPYSGAVNELRGERDSLLRTSEVGFDFFARLHYEYYCFSPQVCQLMEGDETLRREIASGFVAPLTVFLRLLRIQATEQLTRQQLGRRIVDLIADDERLRTATILELDEARQLLESGEGTSGAIRSSSVALLRYLRDHVNSSEHLRWGLLQPIEIIASALRMYVTDATPADLGDAFLQRLEHWAAAIPLTDVWSTLSIYDIRQEIEFLGATVLISAVARDAFFARFEERFGALERLAPLFAAGRTVEVRHG